MLVMRCYFSFDFDLQLYLHVLGDVIVMLQCVNPNKLTYK